MSHVRRQEIIQVSGIFSNLGAQTTPAQCGDDAMRNEYLPISMQLWTMLLYKQQNET